MLLDPILAPRDSRDFFLKQKLQLLAISSDRFGPGATVEDVVYGLIPGVAARSVLLPPTKHRDLYARALTEVAERVREAKGRKVGVDRDGCTVSYRYLNPQGDEVYDTVHVRLLFTDVSFMQTQREAQDHVDETPIDYQKIRAEILAIIEADVELPADARRTLLTLARNPAFPVSELSLKYARSKKERALRLLAEAHAERCARVAYSAVRELSYSTEHQRYTQSEWGALTSGARVELVNVTTRIICGQTTPYQHGVAYGPTFIQVVQQALRHIVGADALYQRERTDVEALRYQAISASKLD